MKDILYHRDVHLFADEPCVLSFIIIYLFFLACETDSNLHFIVLDYTLLAH